MKGIKILAMALLVTAWAGTSRAQNNCGNVATPPKITTSTVAGGSSVLAMQGVEYVAGNYVQVQLVTDGCTDIK